MNNQYYLYYAVSSFGSQISGIGLATSPTLNPSDSNYGWTDHGPVIESVNGSAYNTIDPSILQDTDGKVWMSFGSFWNGIYLTQLNPTTGLRLSNATPTHLAFNSSIEASYIYKRNGFYYLFVNFGACCQGTSSTYNIRVGRSTSITGPFVDQNGVNMLNSGGTLFLGNDGTKIGPGQVGIISQGDLDQFSYHYYDGNRSGAATYGLHTLYWTSDNWPSYTPINPSWNGSTNTNWSTSTNWVGGVPNGKGHTANFVSLSGQQYSVALDGGAKTVGAMNFNSAASYTIGSPNGNSLVLDSTVGSASINVTAGNPTIAAPVTLNDDASINVASASNTLRMSGAVSGSHTITKTGSGVLLLSGKSTYTGGTVISSGTLQLPRPSAAVAIYSFDDVTDASGHPVTSGTLSVGYVVPNSGSGGAGMNGAANPVNNGASIVPGRFGNALQLDGQGSSIDINSPIVDQSGTGTWSMSAWIKTATLGSTFVSKNTGGTTWTPGMSAFYLGSNPPSGTPGGLPTAVRNAGGFVQGNTSVADNAWHMVTFVDSGGTKAVYVDGASISLSQSAFDNADLSTFVRLGFNTDTLSSLDGNVHFNGDLDEMQFFDIALNAQQIQELYSTDTVSSGIATNNQYLPAGTAVNITTSGAKLDLNGNNQTIGSLAGVTGSLVSLGNGVLTSGGNNTSTIFAGVISGSGGIAKTGTGTLTMSGSNTYQGTTSVQGGTLRLQGPGAQAPVLSGGGADITGGKLLLDYSVGGGAAAIDAQVQSILTAGFNQATPFSSGQLRTSSIPSASKGLGWRDDSANSQVIVAYTYYGDANLDGTVNIADFNALASNFGGSGKIWSVGDFNYDGVVNLLDLNALATNFGMSGALSSPALGALVPEPGSISLLALGLAAILRSSHRRRRRN
jgi:autotransporter-associated beta strand protein